MTLLLFDRYAIEPSGVDAFSGPLDEVLDAMRSAPGCLWADAARALDDDPSFIVASEWRTEADGDAWLSCQAADAFAASVDATLRTEVTRRRFASA